MSDVTQLAGDLDWIVMKCLEKDRARRYETASGLAAEIQRHLASEPVIARPPSLTHKVQKARQRNKLEFSAAAAVALALVAGTTVSTWQAVEARAARIDAIAAQGSAEVARANEAELRRRAEGEARKARLLAYDSDMKLAEQALNANHPGRARELLNQHRPQAGEEDLRGWEWHHLWQRSGSDELSTFWHADGDDINSVSFSPDGRFLAADLTIRGCLLFDVATRAVLHSEFLAGNWLSMAFSPRSNLLACCGTDAGGNQVLRLLSLPDLKPVHTAAVAMITVRARAIRGKSRLDIPAVLG